MSETPPLAVVMPVRNALPFLDESVASILAQSFGSFEFTIFDDASTDGSSERLRIWSARDSRIRLVRGGEPLGPAGSSQAAVELSHSPLVARMDADDVAHPERLARQLEVFAAEPDAALVGTLHRLIDAEGRLLRAAERSALTNRSVAPRVHHGSIMFRRQAFDAAGGYRSGTDYWEDIDLLVRMRDQGSIFIIPEELYSARYSAAGVRFNADPESLDRAYEAMARGVAARPGRADGKIPLQAFVLSGTPRLWAGERPRVLGRLLRRGALGFDGESLRVLAWAAWADLHPGSLRWGLNRLSRLRERRVPPRLRSARWVEWRAQGARKTGAD